MTADQEAMKAKMMDTGDRLVSERKYSEAADAYRKCRIMLARALGGMSPELVPVLFKRADALLDSSELSDGSQRAITYNAARSQCRLALAIEQNAKGPNHPDVIRALRKLAMVNDLLGEHVQATDLLNRALDIEVQQPETERP